MKLPLAFSRETAPKARGKICSPLMRGIEKPRRFNLSAFISLAFLIQKSYHCHESQSDNYQYS